MRVVQVGSVAGSAEMFESMLTDYVELVSLPIQQVASRRRGLLKFAAVPLRIAAAVTAARAVRGHNPDIVHIHWAPNGLVGPLSGRPWILHARGSDVRSINALRRIAVHPLLKLADAVLVSTPDLVHFLRPLRDDATYIPNPVAVREIDVAAEWDVGLASAAIPVKGIEVAHAALGQLDHVRAWALEGPLFEPTSGAVAMPVSSKMAFIERVARTRVVVGQLKLGVLGNVELEAMAAGRPVIAYVDTRWYQSDPPPVISATSPPVIARSIAELLEDSSRAAELGAAGRDWVIRNHGFARVRRLLLDVYESILSEKQRPRPQVGLL